MSEAKTTDLARIDHFLVSLVQDAASEEGIEIDDDDPSIMLRRLIIRLHAKYDKEKVAVLIDEYYAPIVQHIDVPANANQARLKLSSFYSSLKSRSRNIGHVFITGVSRFTKTSIFSDLNHLDDLTFDPRFAAVCGLTQAELDHLIAIDRGRALEALVKRRTLPSGSTDDDLRRLLKDWYDGYTWDGRTTIYNPWSILNFFKNTKIDNYWYESGSPGFLVRLFKSGRVTFDLAKRIPNVTESHCRIDDTGKLNAEALLLQTGYLTIKAIDAEPEKVDSFRLGLPNLEVAASFGPLLLPVEKPPNPILACKLAVEFRDCLRHLDEAGVEKSFGQYLAQYSFDFHDAKENTYHLMFLTAMFLSGQPCDPQDRTSQGLSDIHLKGEGGDDIIVELKYHKEEPKTVPGDGPTPKAKKGAKSSEAAELEAMARLREGMAKKAERALRPINKKYAKTRERGPGRLIKAALVVANRDNVLARFKILEREPICGPRRGAPSPETGLTRSGAPLVLRLRRGGRGRHPPRMAGSNWPTHFPSQSLDTVMATIGGGHEKPPPAEPSAASPAQRSR